MVAQKRDIFEFRRLASIHFSFPPPHMKAGVKRKLDSDQDRDDLVPTLTNVVSDYTPLLFLSTALKCETTSKLAKLTAFTKLRKKLYTRLFPVDSHNHYRSNAPVSTTATPHTSETPSSLDETPSVEPQYVNPEAPPSERVEIDPVMASRLKAHQVPVITDSLRLLLCY